MARLVEGDGGRVCCLYEHLIGFRIFFGGFWIVCLFAAGGREVDGGCGGGGGGSSCLDSA